jgi:hypothetical protein
MGFNALCAQPGAAGAIVAAVAVPVSFSALADGLDPDPATSIIDDFRSARWTELAVVLSSGLVVWSFNRTVARFI